jgi:hypothetical protein
LATYDANIRIGVTGQNQIDAAANSINRLQKLIDQVSRGVVLTGADPRRLSAGWNGVANSISRANRELQQFAQTAKRLTQAPQRALPPGRQGGQLAGGGGQVVPVQVRVIEQAGARLAGAVDRTTRRIEAAGGGRGGAGGGGRRPPPPFDPNQYGQPIGPRGARPADFRVPNARVPGSGLQGILGSAAIGGGFPLLFGQGAGAGVGGLLGGGLGGALGGAGGFAGGIVGSLIGTQFDKLKASAIGLADALKSPAAALDAMAASGIKVDGALRNTVTALVGLGRAAEAQQLVLKKLQELGGTDYVKNLVELEKANKELSDEWSKLSAQIQAELLPAFIEFTKAVIGLVKALQSGATVKKSRDIDPEQFEKDRRAAAALGRKVGGPAGIQAEQKELARLSALRVAESEKEKAAGGLPSTAISDTDQRKALDEAIAQQKEVLDLQRRGEDLDRAGIDFRRDQEDQIYNLRKKAADYDREVARFRRDIEDKIVDKQEENARTLAELTRQRRQNVIEQLDQTLEPAGQISALEGGGRAASVDLAREYIRTIAEGQADLQEKETKAKLDIAKVQRDADRFSLDVADKVKDFSDKAADYAKEVEKFKYETAKKVVDLQRQTADYTYAQWERVYKLAATAAERSAAAAQNPQGPVGNIGGSRLSALIGSVESYNGNYGAFNRGGTNQGRTAFGSGVDTNLVNMTIGEIQRRQLAPGVPYSQQLHAVGKYQIIGSTMRGLLQGGYGNTGVTAQDRFTPENQEKLGAALAKARVLGVSVEQGMRGLRQEWVGLQNVGDAALRSAVVELQGGSVPFAGRAAPVSFPSAASVAGAAPKAPSALPLTGVPSSLARPDVSKLVGQYKDLNAESVRYLQDLQQTAREAAKLSEIAAKTRLDRANAELSQQFLQPLLDANQALEDRAAYEREYGDLLKNGALPALAEQLANADQLEKTQLRLLELEQSATQEAIKQTKAQLARTDITIEQRKEQEKILAILQGQAAVLDSTRGTVIQQSDQQRGQIQAAESPEARRQKTLDAYTARKNTREDANRPFDQYMKAKADFEDLVDPLNQLTNAANSVGDAFSAAFRDVATGSKSAQAALSDMFRNIGASFLDMAAQIMTQQVVLKLLGLAAGALGGGGGGFTAAPLPGFSGTGSGLGIAGFASGGSPPVGKVSLVGEKGPELFVPRSSGTVIPASETRTMLESGTSTLRTKAVDEERQAVMASTQSSTMQVEWKKIGDMEVVTRDEFIKGMNITRKQAAKEGQARVVSSMRRDPAFRREMR